jgi:cysteine desulfurase
MSDKAEIYLDNAATTKLDPSVLRRMVDVYTSNWGNTTGLHFAGKKAASFLESARSDIAKSLNVKPSELLFTSSATESINTVLRGIISTGELRKKHIILSAIEHPAVYKTCKYIERYGIELSIIPVNKQGIVNPSHIEEAIRPNTILVVIMLANNEIGTIQPIWEIGNICHENSVPFLVDAVQCLGKIPLEIEKCKIDFMALSGHKIHGPIGVGLLYIRSDQSISPLLIGGTQESGRRASSVNLPGIIGINEAIRLALNQQKAEQSRYNKFRELVANSVSSIPNAIINGDYVNGLKHILSISFENLDGELLAMHLNQKGIAVSTGSSCSSGNVKVSRILAACGMPDAWAKGTIRVSFGRFNTYDEIQFFSNVLPDSVKKVRKIS